MTNGYEKEASCTVMSRSLLLSLIFFFNELTKYTTGYELCSFYSPISGNNPRWRAWLLPWLQIDLCILCRSIISWLICCSLAKIAYVPWLLMASSDRPLCVLTGLYRKRSMKLIQTSQVYRHTKQKTKETPILNSRKLKKNKATGCIDVLGKLNLRSLLYLLL